MVTGMTGAGRSTAAKELEDLGYFVVDNLPPQLVADVVRLVDETRGPMQPIAVVVDVRSGSFFAGLQEVIARGVHRPAHRRCCSSRPATTCWSAAQEAARRPHPLQEGGRLLDGLRRERTALDDLRADADLVIDTTGAQRAPAHRQGRPRFGTEQTTSLKATIVSFGFKYGIPVDADLVADMRFLPNPHWVPDLRPLSGRDAVGRDYVLSRPGAQEFLDQYVPRAADGGRAATSVEGKRFMTVAIGCTGGKHRSVAMTEEIAARLSAAGIDTRAEPPRPGAGVTVPTPRRRRRRPEGGRAGRRPRPLRVPGRAAARRRRPHRGRHRRRQRRLVGPAPRASSACCRPGTCGRRWRRSAATTTGAAPGPGCSSTGSPATARWTTTRSATC